MRKKDSRFLHGTSSPAGGFNPPTLRSKPNSYISRMLRGIAPGFSQRTKIRISIFLTSFVLLFFVPYHLFADKESKHSTEDLHTTTQHVDKVLKTDDASEAHDDHHAASGSGHTDPFSLILLEMALIILCAMFARDIARKLNQPAVLGELIIGIIVGNIGYWMKTPLFVLVMHLSDVVEVLGIVFQSGISMTESLQQVFSPEMLSEGSIGFLLSQILIGDHASNYVLMVYALWIFSNCGVILLLFMVGLESTIEEMLGVGFKAFMVAIIGVVVPFILGYGSGVWLLPNEPSSVHLFIAATLCATSVGITARIFKDLNKIHIPEAKIILGAAVIDDILGLIILAIVVGIVVSGGIDMMEITKLSLLSLAFLATVIMLGERLVRSSIRLSSILDRHNFKLLFPLVVAFLMSWCANLIGLASIVGAFAAGLIFREELFAQHSDKRTVEEMIAPLEALFAPVFFVLMGMQVNLETFLNLHTLGLATLLTIAAVMGKIVSGIPAGKGMDRLSIGIGMIPRGEVGLIFASVGKGLGVVTDSVFSAVVIMVILTTLLPPFVLKWSLSRAKN